MNTLNNQVQNNSTVKTVDVIGKNVLDLQGEKIGTVDEIVLEKVSGHFRYAVIATGGFLGIGADLHAVPWNALEYDVTEEAFKLGRAKDSLKNAPGFNKDQWPDFSNVEYGKSINTYYGSGFSGGNVGHNSSDLPQTTATPNPLKNNF